MKQNLTPPTVPQLPFYRALGVSYIQQYVENISNRTKIPTSSDIPTNKDMDHNISGLPPFSPQPPPSSSFNFFKDTKHNYMPLNKESPPLPRVPNVSSKLSKSCQNLNSSSDHTVTFPPPASFLNHISIDNLINLEDSIPPKPSANSTKKVHSKVKFSDTVTAFIVPEVKRSVKPPLPSHITDPQRELAESLPLCHPNEDYLKDFAPIRKEGETESSEASAPPKIKVVHFGVV